jgi:hypothetical protein
LKLNRELEKKDIWVVIGYSFNDPVIQDIFLNHCSINKHLILVHPKAQEIVNRKFAGAKVKISAINQKFGLIEGEIERDFKAYNHLNYQIMCNVLGAKPKISPQLDRSSTEPPAHFLS